MKLGQEHRLDTFPGKRLVFIGDSLMYYIYHDFVYHLTHGVPAPVDFYRSGLSEEFPFEQAGLFEEMYGITGTMTAEDRHNYYDKISTAVFMNAQTGNSTAKSGYSWTKPIDKAFSVSVDNLVRADIKTFQNITVEHVCDCHANSGFLNRFQEIRFASSGGLAGGGP